VAVAHAPRDVHQEQVAAIERFSEESNTHLARWRCTGGTDRMYERMATMSASGSHAKSCEGMKRAERPSRPRHRLGQVPASIEDSRIVELARAGRGMS
jgi:hypothetical protein